ncbi:MAG: hypothetical protein ABI658_19470 [Acidimicrobiales bacterium]
MAFVRGLSNIRRRWIVTFVFVFVVGVIAACGDDGNTSAPSTTSSASTSASSPTMSSTTGVVPSTTVSTPTTTTTRGAVPGAVEVVATRPGGGSREIVLRWNAVSNVTGYRVLRSDASSGPFSVNADLNITTGKTTAGTDVINILSQQYSYKPVSVAFGSPDASPWFEYIEVISGGAVRRYFRVIAYNANGDAPASVVVCGDPPGHPAC